MARKSKAKRSRKAPSAPSSRGASDRDKAVDALMALLTEHSFEDIGLAEVAGRAGLKLSQLRSEFGSTLAIFAAHIKDIDRIVLAGGEDMTDEPPRERLFDVLMRPACTVWALGRLCCRGFVHHSPPFPPAMAASALLIVSSMNAS